MTKLEFLELLKNRLNGLDNQEIEKHVSFFAEIIDDHIDDGQSEEEAVASLGDIDEIVNIILLDTPIIKIAKSRLNRKTLRGWEIAMLIIGFPLWFPLIVAAAAVILSGYISLWAVIISLWACVGAIVASGVGVLASGIIFVFSSNLFSGFALIGAALICAGLSIFAFFGVKRLTECIVFLTKRIFLWVKNRLVGREEA